MPQVSKYRRMKPHLTQYDIRSIVQRFSGNQSSGFKEEDGHWMFYVQYVDGRRFELRQEGTALTWYEIVDGYPDVRGDIHLFTIEQELMRLNRKGRRRTGDEFSAMGF